MSALAGRNDSRAAEKRLEGYCRDVLSAVEGLHFDCKRKHDRRMPQLEESDKRNLAKVLSGFANFSDAGLHTELHCTPWIADTAAVHPVLAPQVYMLPVYTERSQRAAHRLEGASGLDEAQLQG